MSVKDKFREFKNEIKEVTDNECYTDLEINSYCTEELVTIGYMKRKIESFMYINEFSYNELEEYFRDHCDDICTAYFGEIPEIEFRYAVKDFISNLKYNAVVYRLTKELVHFIYMLKEENANIN